MKRVGRARGTAEALRVAGARRVSGACWQANFEDYVYEHYGELGLPLDAPPADPGELEFLLLRALKKGTGTEARCC